MNLEEMTVDQLKATLERQKASETEAYQLFARCAGSRCAGYVRQFCKAGANIREIKQELRRRKSQEMMILEERY